MQRNFIQLNAVPMLKYDWARKLISVDIDDILLTRRRRLMRSAFNDVFRLTV